jgi:hypothetical protein
MAPWVEAILELWDSDAMYEQHVRVARREAERWSPVDLEPRYERFFATIRRTRSE